MNIPLILIVDDEHANQFLLEGLLNAQGYNTLVAGNGEECLKILNDNKPDLILLDIMMPKMTGVEVLEEIIRNKELQNIPVLMVSAKTSTSDIKECLEMGAIDYVKKPFDELELLARIKVGLRLKKNEDHLREMLVQRNSFVRIISHDLRSPFTAINGFAELLLKDKNLTEDQIESVSYIIKSVEFSIDYFNKLLSWTMLESDDLELNISECDIFYIIDSVIRLLAHKSGSKGISIENSIPENTTIKADETFIRQVFANLISNSIKYTHEGGDIKCLLNNTQGKLEIVISDDGVGMPNYITPENLFSGSMIKSEKGTNGEKGTGIGLSICKKILDAHGFDITFKRKEQGTDFIISIH
ncbi:MAG: hybrid sensor histidine kinase/response regulator [Bacteroidales bacterium]|nr:hybrid sensor histidine kinase/response regulator [Bacteroidales bacterium]